MASPLPPECEARYRHIKELASGGFGAVHLATQRDLDRLVVVKLLHAAVLGEPEQVARFANEAKISAAVDSPHVVKLIEAGFDGVPWIAYEYLPGKSVRALLHEGALPVALAATIALHTLRGLAAAHAAGVLHRDVKPENVLGGEGLQHFKVTDFGIAKWTRDGAVKTRTGFVMGTPAYLAPEILLGEESSAAADVYATGVMLHELLAGAPPFVDDNPVMVMEQHLQSAAPPLPARVLAEEAELGRIVARAMAKQPADRFASAEEMHEALRRLRCVTTPTSLAVQAPAGRAWAPGGQATAAVTTAPRRVGATQAVTRAVSAAPRWSASGKWARRVRVAVGLVGLLVLGGGLSAAWLYKPAPPPPRGPARVRALALLDRVAAFDARMIEEFAAQGLKRRQRTAAYAGPLGDRLQELCTEAAELAAVAIADADRQQVRLPFEAAVAVLVKHAGLAKYPFPPARPELADLVLASQPLVRAGVSLDAAGYVRLRRAVLDGVSITEVRHPLVQRLLEQLVDDELAANQEAYRTAAGVTASQTTRDEARGAIETAMEVLEHRDSAFPGTPAELGTGRVWLLSELLVPEGQRDALEQTYGSVRVLGKATELEPRPSALQELAHRLAALRTLLVTVQLRNTDQPDVDAAMRLGRSLFEWTRLPERPEVVVQDAPAGSETPFVVPYLRGVVANRQKAQLDVVTRFGVEAAPLLLAWLGEQQRAGKLDSHRAACEALEIMRAIRRGHAEFDVTELKIGHPGHDRCCAAMTSLRAFIAALSLQPREQKSVAEQLKIEMRKTGCP